MLTLDGVRKTFNPGTANEVRALAGESAQGWIDDLELVTRDPALRTMLDELGVVLIGYRHLRNVMRENSR